MTLLVNEIFYSIQGESTHSGRPCIFVRLTGCNLRCSYCDTRYAYEQGVKMDLTEIMTRIAAYMCPLVEITGGEPLLQSDTPILISKLLENGYEVLMETNGSLDISSIDGRCIKIVDIKCPTSDESEKNDMENLKRLGPKDQVKFVIENRIDYEYAKETIDFNCPDFPEEQILFSPVSEEIAPAQLAEWILEDNLNVRLNLQIHKIIWPSSERGV
ncbi:MAG: 7-carboxy-7-deazaguanine synthase [Desulfobacteraceae bacterium 4572_187]|nr:MAG: 7-carboxy-7-deazaguanine synthase [Desulfobacteraceae bacterium 4572_187]RLB76390.1 MAG: 7-carboxy-7-deazaguanine synthase [Deltaproteobacteria bacterium]